MSLYINFILPTNLNIAVVGNFLSVKIIINAI